MLDGEQQENEQYKKRSHEPPHTILHIDDDPDSLHLFTTDDIASCKPDQTMTPTTSLPPTPTPATTPTSARYYTDYGNEHEEVCCHPHGQKLLLQNDPRHEEDEGRLAGEQRDDIDVVEFLETEGAQEQVAAEHPQTREHRHLPEHGRGARTRSLLPVHREPLPSGNKHIYTYGS